MRWMARWQRTFRSTFPAIPTRRTGRLIVFCHTLYTPQKNHLLMLNSPFGCWFYDLLDGFDDFSALRLIKRKVIFCVQYSRSKHEKKVEKTKNIGKWMVMKGHGERFSRSSPHHVGPEPTTYPRYFVASLALTLYTTLDLKNKGTNQSPREEGSASDRRHVARVPADSAFRIGQWDLKRGGLVFVRRSSRKVGRRLVGTRKRGRRRTVWILTPYPPPPFTFEASCRVASCRTGNLIDCHWGLSLSLSSLISFFPISSFIFPEWVTLWTPNE